METILLFVVAIFIFDIIAGIFTGIFVIIQCEADSRRRAKEERKKKDAREESHRLKMEKRKDFFAKNLEKNMRANRECQDNNNQKTT